MIQSTEPPKPAEKDTVTEMKPITPPVVLKPMVPAAIPIVRPAVPAAKPLQAVVPDTAAEPALIKPALVPEPVAKLPVPAEQNARPLPVMDSVPKPTMIATAPGSEPVSKPLTVTIKPVVAKPAVPEPVAATNNVTPPANVVATVAKDTTKEETVVEKQKAVTEIAVVDQKSATAAEEVKKTILLASTLPGISIKPVIKPSE